MAKSVNRSEASKEKARLRIREWQRKRREEGGAELREREAVYAKARRAANREKSREISNRHKKKRREENPELFRNAWLKYKYGMPLGEYQQRLKEQGGVCLTCEGNNGGKPLVVDHDHSKPKGEGVRGLLCNGCNITIGAALENPETLRKLAEYLEAYRGA